jgi:hypothetical protein
MEKSLEELSEEYFTAAEETDQLIAKCRKKLNEAYRTGNYLKTYELKRKLTVLYDQKSDILTTAYALKNYYKKDKEVLSA